MDSQLKQRLTGAVILVLLAVLFVPELLRGRGDVAPGASGSASQPVPADANGEGAPLRSYEIDLSDEPRAADTPPEADEPTPAAPAPAATDAPAPSPAASASGRAAAAREAAAAPAVVPAASPARAAPPAAVPAPAPAAPANAVPQRGFAVQVGSFASRDSADRLAVQLRGRKFETFVSPVRSGNRQMYRVRVGPVADRGAAQLLVARLKSAGQKGSVVPLP